MYRSARAVSAVLLGVLLVGCAPATSGVGEPVTPATRAPVGVIPCDQRGLSAADEADCMAYTSRSAQGLDESTVDMPQVLEGDTAAEPAPVAPVEPPAQLWSCTYDPTMNYDWHDDAVCSDGVNLDRPYLLAGDSYVTQDELMSAAAAYAAVLNGS